MVQNKGRICSISFEYLKAAFVNVLGYMDAYDAAGLAFSDEPTDNSPDSAVTLSPAEHLFLFLCLAT